MTDGTPTPPRRPTPITVAAVLLVVAACGCPLAGLALDGALAAIPFFSWFSLPCGWFLVWCGVQLLRVKIESVGHFGAMLGGAATVLAAVALVALLSVMVDFGWPQSERDCFLYGGVSMALSCTVAVFVACLTLIRHSHEYDHWRDARLVAEQRSKWELVEDEREPQS